jgi:hypothetical protein
MFRLIIMSDGGSTMLPYLVELDHAEWIYNEIVAYDVAVCCDALPYID